MKEGLTYQFYPVGRNVQLVSMSKQVHLRFEDCVALSRHICTYPQHFCALTSHDHLISILKALSKTSGYLLGGGLRSVFVHLHEEIDGSWTGSLDGADWLWENDLDPSSVLYISHKRMGTHNTNTVTLMRPRRHLPFPAFRISAPNWARTRV